MLYDLKIILKKSKPVLWYELEVPGGVTFSAQLIRNLLGRCFLQLVLIQS